MAELIGSNVFVHFSDANKQALEELIEEFTTKEELKKLNEEFTRLFKEESEHQLHNTKSKHQLHLLEVAKHAKKFGENIIQFMNGEGNEIELEKELGDKFKYLAKEIETIRKDEDEKPEIVE